MVNILSNDEPFTRKNARPGNKIRFFGLGKPVKISR